MDQPLEDVGFRTLRLGHYPHMIGNRTAAGTAAIILGLIWSLFIFLDYLVHHPDMTKAIANPPYLGLLIFFTLTAGASVFWTSGKIKKAKNGIWNLGFRGIGFYGLILLFSAIIIGAFSAQSRLDDPGLGVRIPYFAVLSSIYAAGLVLVATVAFVYGNLWLKSIKSKYANTDYKLIAIAVGLGTIAFLLTISGLFGAAIMQPFAWLLALGMLGWQWRSALDFIKRVVWQRHELSISKSWSLAVIVFLTSILAVNWIGAFKLFPIGYDGGTLYVNLAELTAYKGSLPAGGQAFAWSVIMSLGQSLFFSSTAVILLANCMGFLVLFTLYRLGRHYLSPAYARLAVLITASLPYFGFQALVEEKVDFAVTYVLLSLFLLATQKPEEGEEPHKLFGRFPITTTTYSFLVAGWLIGFAFSIKYTSILFVLALGAWSLYRAGGRWAFFGGCSLSLALVFGGGLYQFGYLQFDSSTQPILLGIVGLIAGCALIWYAFRQERRVLGFLYFRRSVALLAAAGLAFLPWSVKHLTENGSFSISNLIEGRSAQPEINQSAPWSSLLEDGMEPGVGFGRVFEGDMNRLTRGGRTVRMHPHPSPLPEGEGVYSKLRIGFPEPLNFKLLQSIETRTLYQKDEAYAPSSSSGVTLLPRDKWVKGPICEAKGLGMRVNNPPLQHNKPTEYKPTPHLRKSAKNTRSYTSNHFETQFSSPHRGLGGDIHLAYQTNRNDDTGSGRYEELQRYLGYERGLGLYTSLPYDVTMNTNISGSRYVEVGFLFLLFFPLLLFLGRPTGKRLLTVALPAFALALVWLGLSTISVYAPDGNWDAALATGRLQAMFAAQPNGESSILHGIYQIFWSVISGLAGALAPLYQAGMEVSTFWSMIAMIALAGLVYAMLRPRLESMDGAFKALGGFVFIYLLLWWILGNGILWYAMPVFVMLPILVLRYLEKPESLEGEGLAKSSRWLMSALLGLTLLLNVAYYFTSSFPTDIENKAGIFRWPFVEYVTNPSATDADIYQSFNPVLDDMVRTLNTDDEALVYKVNTFYGFLIENNDTRVFNDPTLDKFDYLSSRMVDQSAFFNMLYEEGFRYILLDLRMHMTDQTPEKTLTAKYIRLADLLLRSPDKARLLYTDNYIADPNGPQIRLKNGQSVNARPGLSGQTVSLGSMALFQLAPPVGR
ncbi:MAG: hypothetical protein AAF741_13575 [Bacteroidota bacterium]